MPVHFLKIFVELLKNNEAFFKTACVQAIGSNFALADIAVQSEKSAEAYRIIVVKHA